MSEWQPIETKPNDGRMGEIKLSGGDICVAPLLRLSPLSRSDRVAMAKEGHWPDHRKFTETHWRYLENDE